MTHLSNKKSFLEIKGLTIQYEVNKKTVTALDNINFEAKQFERLVLLGPSGCGKSSILKAVGGFIKPTNGQIVFDGVEITKPAIDRAFVFQEFDQLLPWKTALENIVFALRATKKIKKMKRLILQKSL